MQTYANNEVKSNAIATAVVVMNLLLNVLTGAGIFFVIGLAVVFL